jgi:hypothetical protein
MIARIWGIYPRTPANLRGMFIKWWKGGHVMSQALTTPLKIFSKFIYRQRTHMKEPREAGTHKGGSESGHMTFLFRHLPPCFFLGGVDRLEKKFPHT